MEINWIAVLVAAIIPTITGFIYYHPKVMGKAWMAASGVTEEQTRSGNMGVIFGVSLLLSLMLATMVNILVIHQFGVNSLLMGAEGFGDPNAEVMKDLDMIMAKYGDNFRTFKHGLFHGILAGLFLVVPVLGTNALFERKGFKYIAVNGLYWIITLGLMGGLICAWK